MKNYLGRHILVEYQECDSSILNDIEKVENLMLEAAKIAKATIIEKCFHKFSPYGISGVVVISESHLAIHTWPEYNYAAVDFFTCSKSCNTKAAIEYLKEKFNCKVFQTKTFMRGKI